MTKREIITELLNGRIPERVGLNESFWPHIVENAWGEQGFEKGTDFINRFDLDLRGIGFFKAPEPRPDLTEVIEESDEWIVERDGWGAITRTWKHKAGTPEHVGFTVTSPEVWYKEYRDAFAAIDVCDHVDLPKLRENYKKAMDEEEFVTYNGLFVFEDLRRILGDVTMLESFLLEPEWIHDFNELVTTKYIEHFELLFSEVGLPDGMHIFEDLGYTSAPFASPACHREMILPYHKKLFGLFKDYDLPVILHTCGDFRPHIESIIESGVNCIQALEAKTGMNVVDLAREYGDRLCFMGNIDVRVLASGDRALIREECLSKLNGMKKLRAPYVYMSDHSIPPNVALADYEYMLEVYRENYLYK